MEPLEQNHSPNTEASNPKSRQYTALSYTATVSATHDIHLVRVSLTLGMRAMCDTPGYSTLF